MGRRERLLVCPDRGGFLFRGGRLLSHGGGGGASPRDPKKHLSSVDARCQLSSHTFDSFFPSSRRASERPRPWTTSFDVHSTDGQDDHVTLCFPRSAFTLRRGTGAFTLASADVVYRTAPLHPHLHPKASACITARHRFICGHRRLSFKTYRCYQTNNRRNRIAVSCN